MCRLHLNFDVNIFSKLSIVVTTFIVDTMLPFSRVSLDCLRKIPVTLCTQILTSTSLACSLSQFLRYSVLHLACFTRVASIFILYVHDSCQLSIADCSRHTPVTWVLTSTSLACSPPQFLFSIYVHVTFLVLPAPDIGRPLITFLRRGVTSFYFLRQRIQRVLHHSFYFLYTFTSHFLCFPHLTLDVHFSQVLHLGGFQITLFNIFMTLIALCFTTTLCNFQAVF